MTRIDRLRELLEEPLLVTNLVNVRYLTGFDSSNAALLVEPDRARLFTDFRYLEAAQARWPKASRSVQTQRSLITWLGGNISGRVGFESSILPVAVRRGTARRRARAGAARRARRAAARRQGRAASSRASAQACAITDRMFERLVTEVKFVGRSRARCRLGHLADLPRGRRARRCRSSRSSAPGATGSQPHGRAGDKVIEPGELVVIDTGCNVGGYVLGLHAHACDRRALRRDAGGVRRRARGAAGGRSTRSAPA